MAQRRVGIWYNDSKENSLETAYQLVGVLRRQGVKPVMGPMPVSYTHLGRLDQLARTLEALNPGGVLERGYALITAHGRALTQAGELRPDQQIGIRMKGGNALARVLSVEEERAHGGQKKAEL